MFKNDLIIKPYHYYLSLSVSPPRIELIIPSNNSVFLDSLCSEALKTGKVTDDHKKYVSAQLKINNETIIIKMRLKGDQLDHYEASPPSYRIKTNKKNTVLGTNKFSLQSLETRNYLKEWFYLNLLEQEDILAIKMDVVELKINNLQTICSFEEHFTHYLTDRYRRPRGVIICISEDVFWKSGVLNDSVTFNSQEEMYLNSPLKIFAKSKSKHKKRAKKLLDGFRKGILNPSEVFDVKKLALHFAIVDLTNTHHSLRWHNNRFYYNPESDKLELIGFDGSSWKNISVFINDDDFLSSLVRSRYFSDKQFVDKYLECLETISNTKFLDQFYESNKEKIEELTKRIYRTKIFYINNFKDYYKNAKWIRENLPEYRTRLMNSFNV